MGPFYNRTAWQEQNLPLCHIQRRLRKRWQIHYFAIGQTTPLSQLDQAKNAWHICIVKEAILLDDSISPASEIASALGNSCEKEHDAMLDRMTISPELRYRFSQDRIASTKTVALKLVLQVRAERRTANVK